MRTPPPILHTLHWLPVHFGIEYKILLHTHHCLYGADPTPETSTRISCAQQCCLVLPRTRLKTVGDGAFVAGMYISPQTVDAFKKGLKTFLFKKFYSD